MANVTLTPTKATKDGVASSTQAMDAADTYFVRNNGRTVLHFVKTGAGAATITIVSPGTVGGLAIADQTVNVPGSTGDVWVKIPKGLFNNGDGDVEFTTDEDTGLTVEAVEI